jgi:hypothetical protein
MSQKGRRISIIPTSEHSSAVASTEGATGASASSMTSSNEKSGRKPAANLENIKQKRIRSEHVSEDVTYRFLKDDDCELCLKRIPENDNTYMRIRILFNTPVNPNIECGYSITLQYLYVLFSYFLKILNTGLKTDSVKYILNLAHSPLKDPEDMQSSRYALVYKKECQVEVRDFGQR